MVPQRTERAAPLAYADAAAVAAAYAAARAARTPPPPPAGTLSEAQLRQLPAKEARRAPAAALSELPAPPAAPAAPARSPPQPRGDKNGLRRPPRLAVAQDDGEPPPGVLARHGQGRDHSRDHQGAGELVNECTCAHPHATVGTVKWQHTQQHSAHCDKRYVRLYVFACASVRVSWFIVRVRGVFCECVECGSVVSVAATWVERALCSLSVFTIYSVMCARFFTV